MWSDCFNESEHSFSIQSDTCSGQTLMPTASCTIGVEFAPTALGSFADSFDIPSNDPDTPVVTFDVTGNGVEPDVGERLSLSPEGADGGFFGLALSPQSLLGLVMLIPVARAARRRARRAD